MQTICVLMAAKNGAKHIADMLESILLQDFSVSEIVISVDESSDNTIEEIKEVLTGRINYKIISGPSCGSTRNFLFLLDRSGNYDFFAFADQDDIWSPFHISQSVQALNHVDNSAALCFSDTAKSRNKWKSEFQTNSISYQKLLLNNPAKGCTIVFNKQARDLLRNFSEPNIRFHDWWTALVVAICGKVVKINQTSVWYRQHPNQQIGAKSGFSNLKFKVKNFRFSIQESHLMIEKIMEAKLQIPINDIETLNEWNRFRNRQSLNFFSKFNSLLRIKPSSSTKLKTIFGWLYLLFI